MSGARQVPKGGACPQAKDAAVMRELSVIICAHNPRPHYFRRVLEALRSQTLPKSDWELLLIDNSSSMPLRAQWDISWHLNGRHCLESELGLSAARQRGIRESSGPVLVFVDDDNVLDANYLSTALSIGKDWPKLGTWGSGATIPEFERQPPETVNAFLPYLALRDADAPRWGNVPVNESTPWGAGLCVRREIAEAYCDLNEQSKLKITGRKGKSLLSCEDMEISYVARRRGFGTDVVQELNLVHLIAKERLSTDYLLSLCQASHTCHLLLTYKWSGSVPNYPFRPRGLLSVVKNWLTRRGLDRRRYLANVRAVIEARRLIAASRTQR